MKTVQCKVVFFLDILTFAKQSLIVSKKIGTAFLIELYHNILQYACIKKKKGLWDLHTGML